jgi:hypothetical protein
MRSGTEAIHQDVAKIHHSHCCGLYILEVAAQFVVMILDFMAVIAALIFVLDAGYP